MTMAAWMMLIATWSVIIYFTGKYFWKVLTMPLSPERVERARDGILEKDA